MSFRSRSASCFSGRICACAVGLLCQITYLLLTKNTAEAAAGLQSIVSGPHELSLKQHTDVIFLYAVTVSTDAWLHGVFQVGLSRVKVRIRSSPCDLDYESWFQKPESRDGENRVILRLLVLTQYQRVTDRQTDTPPIANSRSSIAERDVNGVTLQTCSLPMSIVGVNLC